MKGKFCRKIATAAQRYIKIILIANNKGEMSMIEMGKEREHDRKFKGR